MECNIEHYRFFVLMLLDTFFFTATFLHKSQHAAALRSQQMRWDSCGFIARLSTNTAWSPTQVFLLPELFSCLTSLCCCCSLQLHRVYSFLDYIMGGCQIHFTVIWTLCVLWRSGVIKPQIYFQKSNCKSPPTSTHSENYMSSGVRQRFGGCCLVFLVCFWCLSSV